MDKVKIPPLVHEKYPLNYTECGSGRPTILHIKVLGSFNSSWTRFENNTLHCYNENVYVIKANTCQTIAFPLTIITSLPALCLITCNSWIYYKNLTYMVNSMPTNDSYLYISLFNYTKESITLNPFDLQLTCKIVVTGQPHY